VYCQVEEKNPKLDPNSIIKCKIYIKMKRICYQFKIKSSHPHNLWNDDIDDDIGDTHPLIPIH